MRKTETEPARERERKREGEREILLNKRTTKHFARVELLKVVCLPHMRTRAYTKYGLWKEGRKEIELSS